MKQRGQRNDLAWAILFGVLWVTAGMIGFQLFPETSIFQKLALGVVTLPLLWLSARNFALYWRRRPG